MSNNETTKMCAFCNRPIPKREFLANEAMTFAMCFELAASLVEQFGTTRDAAAALENEALRLRRNWSTYPVKAPGEREYLSWFPVQSQRRDDPLPEVIATRFRHVEVCDD